MTHLTHLDLSYNRITAEGVQALVDTLLQPGSHLIDLRIANNWFGPEGVFALARALEANVGLQRLDVSNADARPAEAWRVDTDQHALKTLADSLLVCHYYMYDLLVLFLKTVLCFGRKTKCYSNSMCPGLM
jgi:hypothetical protein